jgi:hypothetical protein
MSKTSSFQEDFNSFISERISRISFELLKNNSEYKEAGTKILESYSQIENLLPLEHKCLISDIDSNFGIQLVVVSDVIYKQGLKDGKELITTCLSDL